jgi:SAM-dependent methyltransferase
VIKKAASQQDYWNSRAGSWNSYDIPLMPSQQDLNFMRKQLIPAGDTLILGVTPPFCSMALEISKTVTAADFADDMITTLRLKGVRYECMDWNEFLEQDAGKFDNIMTDGGLCCVEFPITWKRLAANIDKHLRPNGIFAARVFMSTSEPPKDKYENPNLARFISGIAGVNHNWMMKVETHDDYKDYDVHYAFPPEQIVLQTFDRLTLHDKLIPDYEEGERFVSYAWQKS